MSDQFNWLLLYCQYYIGIHRWETGMDFGANQSEREPPGITSHDEPPGAAFIVLELVLHSSQRS